MTLHGILVAIACVIVGLILGLVWPGIKTALDDLRWKRRAAKIPLSRLPPEYYISDALIAESEKDLVSFIKDELTARYQAGDDSVSSAI